MSLNSVDGAALVLPSARVLWAIPLVYLIMVTGEFLALTQIALLLTERGEPVFSVGVLTSAFWIGIMLASTCAARIVARYGHTRSFIVATVVSSLAFGSLVPHVSYSGWLLGVTAMGLAGGIIWVAGEAWLVESAPAERRGFFVGMFETSVGIGMCGGPAMLPLLISNHIAPLGMAFGLTAFAALISIVLLRQHSASFALKSSSDYFTSQCEETSWRSVALPLLAIAVVSGVLESGSSALLPAVSLRLGFGVSSAAWLGSVIGAGSALLPTPSGLLADRIGLRRALLLAWTILIVSTLVLTGLALTSPVFAALVLWPVGFALGGIGAVIYTLIVIELGHRLTGTGLIHAMAVMVTAYTVGTSIGPVVGGALFDFGGLAALAAGLSACSIAGWILTRRRVADISASLL